jgi:hypothetical protein
MPNIQFPYCSDRSLWFRVNPFLDHCSSSFAFAVLLAVYADSRQLSTCFEAKPVIPNLPLNVPDSLLRYQPLDACNSAKALAKPSILENIICVNVFHNTRKPEFSGALEAAGSEAARKQTAHRLNWSRGWRIECSIVLCKPSQVSLTRRKKKQPLTKYKSVEVYYQPISLGGIRSRRRPRSLPISLLSHFPSIAFRSTPDKLLWLTKRHPIRTSSSLTSLRSSEGKREGSKTDSQGKGMLPAPVPGVGRRQCYLNVIKGGHQSWRSTTSRPVGRDAGCVPPFGLGE